MAVVNQRIIGFYSSAVHVAINFFDSFLGLQLFSSGDRFSSVAVPVYISVCVYSTYANVHRMCLLTLNSHLNFESRWQTEKGETKCRR